MCLWISGAINSPGTLGLVCFLHMTLKGAAAQLLTSEWQAAASTPSLLARAKKVSQLNKALKNQDKDTLNFHTKDCFPSGSAIHFLEVFSQMTAGKRNANVRLRTVKLIPLPLEENEADAFAHCSSYSSVLESEESLLFYHGGQECQYQCCRTEVMKFEKWVIFPHNSLLQAM